MVTPKSQKLLLTIILLPLILLFLNGGSASARPSVKATLYVNDFCIQCQREAAPGIRKLKLLRGQKTVVGFQMNRSETRSFARRLGWTGRVSGDPDVIRATRDGVSEPTWIVVRVDGKVVRRIQIVDPGPRTRVVQVKQFDIGVVNPDDKPTLLRYFPFLPLVSTADNVVREDFRAFTSGGARNPGIQIVAFTCAGPNLLRYRRPSRQGGTLVAVEDCQTNSMTRDLRYFTNLAEGTGTRVLDREAHLVTEPSEATRVLGSDEPWMKLESSSPVFPAVTITSSFQIDGIEKGPVAIQNFMYSCPTCQADGDHYKLQAWQDAHPEVRQIATICASAGHAASWGRSRGWNFPIYSYKGNLGYSDCLKLIGDTLFNGEDLYWNSDTLLIDGVEDRSNCAFEGHPKWRGEPRGCR